MSKRTLLSIIIFLLCFLNFYTPILPDANESYFDFFRLAYNDDTLSIFWKVVFMSPTGIIIILTALHIMEPKSETIKRGHLAAASIIGFLVYLTTLAMIYGFFVLTGSLADILVETITQKEHEDPNVGIGTLGINTILYPLLFLSYVLVHQLMKYKKPEVSPPPLPSQKDSGPLYDEDELL
jgi:hypothetical protein